VNSQSHLSTVPAQSRTVQLSVAQRSATHSPVPFRSLPSCRTGIWRSARKELPRRRGQPAPASTGKPLSARGLCSAIVTGCSALLC